MGNYYSNNNSNDNIYVVENNYLITIQIKKCTERDVAKEVPYVKQISNMKTNESINNYDKYTVEQEILPEWIHRNNFGSGYQIILTFYKTKDDVLNASSDKLYCKEYMKPSLEDQYYYLVSEYRVTDKIRTEYDRLGCKTVSEYNDIGKLHGKVTKFEKDGQTITSLLLYQDGLLHGISFENKCNKSGTGKTINTNINYKKSIVKDGKVKYVYDTKNVTYWTESHVIVYREYKFGTLIKSWSEIIKEITYEKETPKDIKPATPDDIMLCNH